jgi:hypothetical protein
VHLDLDEHRNLGELIGLTFTLFGRHLAVFLSLTLLVVAPIGILVDGVWGGFLADGGDASASVAASVVSFMFAVVVIPPLVTALHVVVVQGLARGEEPAVGSAVSGAAPRLLPAVGAVAVYALAVALGLVLLIVPGIYLAVRWYFAAQAAVVDTLAGPAALERGGRLVDGRWWRVFGLLLVFSLITGTFGAVGGVLAREIDSGALFMTASIVLQTVTLSLGAIFGTLLFFDLRARARLPWQGTPRMSPVAPERPIQPPRI